MKNTIRENFYNEKKRNKNSKLLNGMISIIRKVIKNPEMIPDDISERIIKNHLKLFCSRDIRLFIREKRSKILPASNVLYIYI